MRTCGRIFRKSRVASFWRLVLDAHVLVLLPLCTPYFYGALSVSFNLTPRPVR